MVILQHHRQMQKNQMNKINWQTNGAATSLSFCWPRHDDYMSRISDRKACCASWSTQDSKTDRENLPKARVIVTARRSLKQGPPKEF